MHRSCRGAVALLCILTLIFSAVPALAEFSPRYARARESQDISLALTAQFDTHAPLSDASCALLNEWLQQTDLTIAIQGKNESISLNHAASPLLSIAFARQSDYTLTSFSSSGAAYLTRPDQKDALALLTETDYSLPDFSGLPDLYAALAQDLYPFLAGVVSPKSSQTTTSIKNANASASYTNYTLTAEQMNQIWPNLLEMLLPLMQEALSGQERWYQEAEALLKELIFSGECRFKRFLDKSKGDMGLQFTGNAAKGDDLRKVTLFGGYTPGKGGYISLALPAVKGDNNFKISFTGKTTTKENTRTLIFESSFARTMDGKSQSFSMEGTLKNAVKNGDESWSGKITLNTKGDALSASYTSTPSLSFTDEGLQGEIALQKKENKETKIKGTICIAPAGAQAFAAPGATTAQDLRSLNDEQARAIVAREMLPLSRMLYQMMAALPEESRALLTHDLRTDEWMNGESVPVIPGNPKDSWILDEDDENCWIVEEDEE